jgi:large subunit ribosomal protein L25
LQRDPVTDEILHADFIHIAMDKVIRVSVPVVSVGEAVGVKAEGGFVDFITREVEVECLPKDIPEHIEIDISGLHLRQSLKGEDVTLPEGVKLITSSDTILVMIEVPVKEEEIEVEEEEEEEVIAEEEEPEVIGKEKPEKGKEIEEATDEKRGKEEKGEKRGKETREEKRGREAKEAREEKREREAKDEKREKEEKKVKEKE